MQRISFDFMKRRIQSAVRKTKVQVMREIDGRDADAVAAAKKKAAFIAQFIPQMRYGSYLPRAASDADSRPVRRRLMRIGAFNDFTHQYPGEPRKARRRMAANFLKNLKRTA